ncbi:SGNH/GDSL hydrolase family protein, partial [Rhizobium ruizarguesonis]
LVTVGTPLPFDRLVKAVDTFATELSKPVLTQIDRVVAEQPDIILIELYANDATLHRFASLAQSRKNIGDILDQLRQRLPQERIVVMAMNPCSGLRGLIRPFVDSYISAH